MSDAIVSWKDYVDVRFEAQEKGVQTALSAAEKAVIKAETAAEKRFELLNELREGVATKEQLEALEKVVNELKDRLNTSQGKNSGISAFAGWIVAAIGLAATIITIILKFNN